MGQDVAVGVDYTQLDAVHLAAGLGLAVALGVAAGTLGHLGHAPDVADRDAVVVLERVDEHPRRGRTSDGHLLQGGHVSTRVLQVLHNAQPDRGNPGRERDVLGFDEVHDGLGAQVGTGQHELGTAHRGGERQRPAVDVEHRHNAEHGMP